MHSVRVTIIISNAPVHLDLLVILLSNVYEFQRLALRTKTVLKVTRVETQCAFHIVDLIKIVL